MSNLELPAGWVRTSLADVGEVVSGATPKTNIAEYWGGDIPWITPDDLSKNPAKRTKVGRRSLTRSGYNSCSTRIVPPESVLFSSRAPIGYVTIASDYLCTNQGFKTIIPGPAACADYLYWYLQYKTPDIIANASGTTFKEISGKKFAETELLLPPLAEQYRIVEALEDHLSRLDAATEAVTSAKRRLNSFSASVLNRTTLGISSTAGFVPGTGNSSHALLQNLSSRRFEYTALPPLPEGWFWRQASDVCTLISSGSTPKAHLMHAGSGDVPFLKVYNITQDGQVDFTNKPTYIDRETHEIHLKRSRVRPGDVITNIVGPPLGKTAVVPNQHPEWNINQAIVVFRSGPDIQPEWLALILQSPTVIEMLKKTAKATAGQFNIALSTCRELPLPIPPRDVQLELVKQSAEILEISDRFNKQAAIISLRAKKFRQAVLRRAFLGKLVPQSPADEPPSILLDRIRAEQEPGDSKAQRATRRRQGETTAKTSLAPSAPTTTVQQELPL
ncbi:hypothetical protein DMC61_32190 [Amycolatopsis sp. WAC 04169]|uniref:restriction endonuclease subunit S n=1 Tax=Amycolatopsis sp. WAC 04169 TaxID=2203197 RepID=UPI000F771D36|nr:restriction endonuclease subunit S [Amycolatopsis sp. WAC 04169]RSN23359.1 hypothetical protein DMC61_32190 [Amycolatopsis sp. WAC 04169]